jgi:hypothetical protein
MTIWRLQESVSNWTWLSLIPRIQFAATELRSFVLHCYRQISFLHYLKKALWTHMYSYKEKLCNKSISDVILLILLYKQQVKKYFKQCRRLYNAFLDQSEIQSRSSQLMLFTQYSVAHLITKCIHRGEWKYYLKRMFMHFNDNSGNYIG